MKPDRPPLDRWRFDAIVSGPEKLWGLAAISSALGLSLDATRKLAKSDAVPITRPAGSKRYFALRSELNAWLRGDEPEAIR